MKKQDSKAPTKKYRNLSMVDRNTNPYYKDNPAMFDVLCQMLETYFVVVQKVESNQELFSWLKNVVTPLHGKAVSTATLINWVLYGRTAIPKCHNCTGDIDLDISILGTYSEWCSCACRASDPVYKKMLGDSLEAKYGPGVRHNWQIPGATENNRRIKKEKYGDENYNNRKKAKETFVKHYGVDNNMKCEKGLKEYTDAMEEKYGVPYTWLVPEINEKAKQTTFDHFGVYVSSQAQEVKEVQAKTNIEVYGCKCPLQNPDVHKKSLDTMNKMYNVDHPSQSPEIRKLQKTNVYHYDGQVFNSSWEVCYWIFCVEHGIKIEHEPCCFRYVDCKGKSHKYFPDFRINGDTFIELKGDDQFDANGKMIDKLDPSKNYIAEAKQQCMIDNNVKVLKFAEMKPYFEYIEAKYGKSYLKSFKVVKGE